MIDQSPCGIGRRDIAADDLHFWESLLHPFDAIEHALRVAVRGVDHDYINPGFDQRRRALLGALADADRSTHTQAAKFILARVRMFGGLLNVLNSNQAEQFEILVHHQHALEPVLVHQRHCILAGCTFAHGDQFGARRHDVFDGLPEIGFETQIAIGDNADHPPARIDHRQPRNLVLVGQREHITHFHVLGNRDRVFDDAALEPFDLGHFCCQRSGGHVLVYHADAAFLGDGYRQPGFGHGVHGSGQQRDIESDRAREPGFQADVPRQDRGVGGNQQDIVEGQGFLDHAHLVFPRKTALYAYRRKPPSIRQR